MSDRSTYHMHREPDAMPIASGRARSIEAASDRSTQPLDALFLLNALSIGGSERKIVRLANRLGACNMRAGIVALNGPDTLSHLLHPSVERWCLDRRGKFSLRAVGALADVVNRRSPRVLFTVNLYPALYAAAMKLLRSQAPPVVGLINTTDLGPRDRWRQQGYKHVLARLDWLVYGCELQRDAWGRVSSRLRGRSEVIYNGVDLEEFEPATDAARAAKRRELGIASDEFVIGSVGRLIPAKNHRVLIDALAQLRATGATARLIIVGDGPLRGDLERQARERGVFEFVTFTGALHDVRPIVGMLDVFVLPSLYIETFSNAALEAMALGIPVILSRIAGAAEMIRDGEEGLLIEPAELERHLPSQLHELSRDRQRRQRMGEQARRRVVSEFGFPTMVERYASIVRRYTA